MTISICDVCLKPPAGTALTPFVVSGVRFDVCASCEEGTYRTPPPHHFTVTIIPAQRCGVSVVVAGGSK